MNPQRYNFEWYLSLFHFYRAIQIDLKIRSTGFLYQQKYQLYISAIYFCLNLKAVFAAVLQLSIRLLKLKYESHHLENK